jgi:hypothetical protein
MVTQENKQSPLECLSDPAQIGLMLLGHAYVYSQDTKQDLWQFALEIDELKRHGLTNNEFRWMLARNLVKHAQEITPSGAGDRKFRPLESHLFPSGTCFVPTEIGLSLSRTEVQETTQQHTLLPNNAADHPAFEFAAENASQLEKGIGPLKRLTPNTRNGEKNRASDDSPNSQTPNILSTRPKWDAAQKRLTVGSQVVKLYRWPAINQETILAVFEEDGWPNRIDDPLSVVANLDPKRRLHDTIKCLNRGQEILTIRFRGDGTGAGVKWEFAVNDAN